MRGAGAAAAAAASGDSGEYPKLWCTVVLPARACLVQGCRHLYTFQSTRCFLTVSHAAWHTPAAVHCLLSKVFNSSAHAPVVR